MTATTSGAEAQAETQMGPLVRRLPPSLLCEAPAGRVAVVGGSLERTGAPFFASMAALRCGAEQALVLCTREAAAAVGAYAPEVRALPLLDAEHGRSVATSRLAEAHSLVVGPGLGEDVALQALVVAMLRRLAESKSLARMSLVFDGDGIGLLADNKDVVAGHAGRVYLTASADEVRKLAFAYLGRRDVDGRDHAALGQLAARVNRNAVLVLKGREDRIVVEGATYTCSVSDGLRRIGGHGDLMAGFLAVFAYWAALHDDEEGSSGGGGGGADDDDRRGRQATSPPPPPAAAVAAYAACALVRHCSRFAFQSAGRSAITSDMLAQIPKAFAECFAT